jgi:hypothetical protein
MINDEEFHWNLPKISNKVRMRRIRFTGHCYGAKNQPLHQHLLFKFKAPEKWVNFETYVYVNLKIWMIKFEGVYIYIIWKI